MMQATCIWFVGLSGAGKSALCYELAGWLRARGRAVHVLEADDCRSGLCSDLGFSLADRAENLRRITHVAELIRRSGLDVLVTSISPLERYRDYARSVIPDLIEVFVDAPLAVCEARDPKGLYRKARLGLIRDFTGIDSPFERPLRPDVICQTGQEAIPESIKKVLDRLGLGSGATGPESRRPTIAVDFDGVIAEYDGWKGEEDLGDVRQDVILALRELRLRGWKIVVHTTRSSHNVRGHLVSADVPFDEINVNTDYGNLGQKPVATVYWDDRAVRYSGDAQNDLTSILNFRTWTGRA